MRSSVSPLSNSRRDEGAGLVQRVVSLRVQMQAHGAPFERGDHRVTRHVIARHGSALRNVSAIANSCRDVCRR